MVFSVSFSANVVFFFLFWLTDQPHNFVCDTKHIDVDRRRTLTFHIPSVFSYLKLYPTSSTSKSSSFPYQPLPPFSAEAVQESSPVHGYGMRHSGVYTLLDCKLYSLSTVLPILFQKWEKSKKKRWWRKPTYLIKKNRQRTLVKAFGCQHGVVFFVQFGL